MRILKTYWRHLFVITLALSILAQCSKEDQDAKNFEVTLLNKSPLVRVTKRTISETLTMDPNWFDVSMRFTNNSSTYIKIEEIMFFVTVDGEEGGAHSFDLGTVTRKEPPNDVEHKYPNYCTYPNDGASYPVMACEDPYGTTDDPTPYATVSLGLYVDGIPSSTVNPKNLVYQVRLQILGVKVNTADWSDAGRFEKNIYFSTQ